MPIDLWTPQGVVPVGTTLVGGNKETGSGIVSHRFTLKAKDKFGVEHVTRVEILADKDTSKEQVEDMMANSAEAFVKEVREKYSKRRPTADEKKEIGKILEDFRKQAIKRKESTNNTLYYQVK